MGEGVLARSRAQVGLRLACVGAFAALTAGAGSCAASAGSTVTATGTTLTIYASAPAIGSGSTDVLEAEKLAYQQKRSEVSAIKLRFITLTGKPSDNARQAIEDPSTVAYVGEVAAGASADSLGITNAEDVLQVSPTDTAIALTQSSAAVPGAPDDYYEAQKSYGRTFARVTPSALPEARVQVDQMTALHVRRLYVSDDGSAYGAAIALAVRQAAAAKSITIVASGSGADGAFYGASSATRATAKFDALAEANPAIKLFGPSPLAEGLSTSARNVYVSSPGFLVKDLPPEGRRFVSDFKSIYGHDPAPGAIFGYEALSSVLDVLREAGTAAKDRATVVKDFFAIRNRTSPLGTYSIESSGDISIAPFVFGRVRAGKFVASRFVAAQG